MALKVSEKQESEGDVKAARVAMPVNIPHPASYRLRTLKALAVKQGISVRLSALEWDGLNYGGCCGDRETDCWVLNW